MTRRVIPFLMLAAIFLLISCGTSTSPQSEYAAQIAPAVDKLLYFQDHYARFEALLTAPLDPSSGSGISRLDMLVGESSKLAREGKDIQAVLSDITPETNAQAAHQAVLQCVQTRADFAEGLAISIKNLEPVDLSGDVSVCSSFDTDLEMLTSYVSDNR